MLLDAAGSDFHPYSGLHATVVAAALLATMAAICLRRRWDGTPLARRLDIGLGAGGLAVWAAYRVYLVQPGVYLPDYSFPLQLCDWSGLAVPLALWTGSRPLRAVTYFWGIGLSIQGLIQPDLHHGPRSPKFWLFWASHAAIVGGAAYDVAARGYRPALRDFGVAVAATFVYGVVAFAVDVACGFNYGYLGRSRPNQPPILDALGAWPGRVAIIVGLVFVVFALLWMPWELARRVRGRRDDPAASRRPSG